jgi:hypothetical protein
LFCFFFLINQNIGLQMSKILLKIFDPIYLFFSCLGNEYIQSKFRL